MCYAPRATAKTVNGERLCCVCDTKLKGRIDKAFCDYTCKNEYHKEIRKKSKQAGNITIKRINRNYDILSLLMGENTSKYCINRMELVRLGFDFQSISGYEQNKYGLKLQVFEYSWYLTKNQNVMVYRDPDHVPISPFVYKRWERHISPKAG